MSRFFSFFICLFFGKVKSVEFQISKKEEIKQMSCEKINKLSPLNTNHNNYSDMEDTFATQGTCSWNPDSRYPSGDQSLANVIPVLRILGRPSLPSPSFSSPPQGHPRDQFWGPSFKVPTRGPISGRCSVLRRLGRPSFKVPIWGQPTTCVESYTKGSSRMASSLPF